MEDEYIPPPTHPPPFLKHEQLTFLSQQGWLPIDLSESLIADMQLVSADAMSYFAEDEDMKKELYPSSHGTECGYYVVPEEKEYLTFRHRLHPDTQLEQHVSKSWKQAATLLHRILCDLGKFHYCHPKAWDPMVEGTFDLCEDATGLDDNTTLMRLFKYYPGGIAEPHVDIGLLTLCIGGGSGLELLDQSQKPKQWIPAQGPTILVGGMTSVLLSGRVLPGKHRVVGNPDGRSSIIFTLRPCLKADIDLGLFGGWGTMSSREVFNQSKATRYNINAKKDLREKQRKETQERKKRLAQSEEDSKAAEQAPEQPPEQPNLQRSGFRSRLSRIFSRGFKEPPSRDNTEQKSNMTNGAGMDSSKSPGEIGYQQQLGQER